MSNYLAGLYEQMVEKHDRETVPRVLALVPAAGTGAHSDRPPLNATIAALRVKERVHWIQCDCDFGPQRSSKQLGLASLKYTGGLVRNRGELLTDLQEDEIAREVIGRGI
jgi:hypothetical protein